MPKVYVKLLVSQEFESVPELERNDGESPLQADMEYAEFLAEEIIRDIKSAFHGGITVDMDYVKLLDDANNEHGVA